MRGFVCLSLAVFACAASYSQTTAFDVASVKPSLADNSVDRHSHFSVSVHEDGTRVEVRNTSLFALILRAYGVRAYQVSGPDWMDGAYFDIAAILPAGAGRDQVEPALQALLASRFHLVVRRERKELPVYALVPAGAGSKLKAAADPQGTNGTWDSTGKFTGRNETLAHFGEVLARGLDRPVLDMTGLAGSFDFELNYAPEDRMDPSAISHAMQEQLGLKLEARKSPLDLLKIDQVDKVPTAN